MRQQKTLRERIETRIARKRDNVFLTREFVGLAGRDQVMRVLRGLVQDQQLVRLGYGVYGRAIVSRLSGEPILNSPDGFVGAVRQALDKLWREMGAHRVGTRIQRRHVKPGAGQSDSAREGTFLAASS